MSFFDSGSIAQRKMDSYRARGEQARRDRAETAAGTQTFIGQLLSAAADICLSYDGIVAEDDGVVMFVWPTAVKGGPSDLFAGILALVKHDGKLRLDIVCSSEEIEHIDTDIRKAACKNVESEIRRLMTFFSILGNQKGRSA